MVYSVVGRFSLEHLEWSCPLSEEEERVTHTKGDRWLTVKPSSSFGSFKIFDELINPVDVRAIWTRSVTPACSAALDYLQQRGNYI